MFASLIILVFAVVVVVLSRKKPGKPQVVVRKIEFEGDTPTDFLEEPEFTVTSTEPQVAMPAEEAPVPQPATVQTPQPATAPTRPAERRKAAAAQAESEERGLKLDDVEKRKLIIYSEIMKPKYEQ